MRTIKEISENNKAYDDIIMLLEKSKKNDEPIDEGLVKAIVGAAAGAALGPSIMKAVCKILGIDTNGALGNLMTSKMIISALVAYLGWKN